MQFLIGKSIHATHNKLIRLSVYKIQTLEPLISSGNEQLSRQSRGFSESVLVSVLGNRIHSSVAPMILKQSFQKYHTALYYVH